MKKSPEFFKLVLDSVTEHIVVINTIGEIIFVNKAWLSFAKNNACVIDYDWIGGNYLEECDKAAVLGDKPGIIAGEGIKKVINGEEPLFYLEYPCNSQYEERWFMMQVIPFQANDTRYFVISHQNITERKNSEANLKEIEKKLNNAQRLAKVGSWTLDLANNKLEWSDEIFRLFEIDQKKFGASYEAFLDTVHPDDIDKVNKAYKASLINRTPYEITHRLLMSDGRVKYVNETCETFFNDEGQAVQSHGTVQDITEKTVSQETINLYENVFRCSAEAKLITDKNNQIIAVNPALSKLTGYTFDELAGKNPNILASGETQKEIYNEMWKSLNHLSYWQGELMDKRKDGTTYPKWTTISVVYDKNKNTVNYVASFVDISDRKKAAAKIKHLAHHDTLTGLYNRHSLKERLAKAIALAQQNRQSLVVMFLDMDRFKLINDTLGHHIGDRLLVEIGKRLKENIRHNDIVARLGGDEFVIVINNIAEENRIISYAENIIKRLSDSYVIASNKLESSTSIGISLYPADGQDVQTLMKNADTAMYHAKAMGRNNYQFFQQELNASVQEKYQIKQELHQAIKNNHLVLYYQAKVDASSEKVIGAEVLVRWLHPEKGLIMPDKFIPVAEETGMILQLGDWVLEEACRNIVLMRDNKNINVSVSVNISPQQLRDNKFIDRLSEMVSRYTISEGELELEITENDAMTNAEHAIETMKCIRKLGINLAIDDFGTGYSSLTYLKLFPIQVLKLDRTFVRDIEQDENDAAISSATIALAHKLGLKVVAEGVETKAQQQFLLAHHCDCLQGYLFSKPVPYNDFLDYVNKNNKLLADV